MIDPFDYKEPHCALCGGKEFYNPKSDDPSGRIPVKRIIEKLDGFFARDDMSAAGKLLEYWQTEAKELGDKNGELSVVNELIGYYRKTGEKEKGLAAAERGLFLLDALGLSESVSGATVILNAATTLKAFGDPARALALYDKTYIVFSRDLDAEDRLFGGFYNNKALALEDMGQYEEAEKCYKAAKNVMSKFKDGLADLAITCVNMAHLYEKSKRAKSMITDCLFEAYKYLNDEELSHDGYYAFVCAKCAPSFAHFGYGRIAAELEEESDKIYERT